MSPPITLGKPSIVTVKVISGLTLLSIRIVDPVVCCGGAPRSVLNPPQHLRCGKARSSLTCLWDQSVYCSKRSRRLCRRPPKNAYLKTPPKPPPEPSKMGVFVSFSTSRAKTRQDAPKTPQGTLKGAPRDPKITPSGPQVGLKGAQEGPNMGPKTPPKRGPRAT